jgi:hypothetical protein
MEDLKVEVKMKEGKYPYIEDKDVSLISVNGVKGRPIYLSSKFVYGNTVTLKRIHDFVAKLDDAKILMTGKGTLVIKYEKNSTLYLIEIPSVCRSSIYVEVDKGDCYTTEVLTSLLGEVKHVWCNGNATVKYEITSRTSTGAVNVEEGKVNVIFDDELDKL